MLEEIWLYTTIVLGVTTVALTVLFLIERGRRMHPRSEETPVKSAMTLEKILSTERSVSDELVKEVRDRLRVLDVEREILSYAIRRLYEAQAEGRITPEERDALANKYREDLERIKEEIMRGETIVALNELERMREEFIKTFSERLEAIDRKIKDLRALTRPKSIEQVKPLKGEVKVEETREQVPSVGEKTEKPVAQRRQRETAKRKTAEGAEDEAKERAEKPVEREDVDRSIEKIVAEIEGVLSRLSQIEAEE